MVTIDNKELANYLMFKLDKLENAFSEEELEQVEELVLNPYDINEEYHELDLDILKYFKNLKTISFSNLLITDLDFENLYKMPNLTSLNFDKCTFENINKITSLNLLELSIINCDIEDFSFVYDLNTLKSLSIINGNLSLSNINNLKDLVFLEISSSSVTDIEKLSLPLLEELYIDKTNINNLDIVIDLPNLKKLGLSSEQYENNKSIIETLQKRNVKLLNDGIVPFEERDNND